MTTSETITLSAGEWASLCGLAARGSGFAWGLSEDAGSALATLARWGVDASGAALEVFAGETAGRLSAPDGSGAVWAGQAGRALCPIRCGALLSDLGPDAVPEGGLLLNRVFAPLLLLPFADAVARRADRKLHIETAAGAGALGLGDLVKVLTMEDAGMALDLKFDFLSEAFVEGPPECGPKQMSRKNYTALWGLAMNTTVPETDALRASGAGAGAIDND